MGWPRTWAEHPRVVGRTRSCSGSLPGGPEHHRVGGEDPSTPSHPAYSGGTPPRRRGGRGHRQRGRPQHRNTPASAGKTTLPGSATTSRAEHPRVGGEEIPPSTANGSASGTPPRQRGGLHPNVQVRPLHRNTPASAGRTSTRTHATATWSEHPRVGGEDPALHPRDSKGRGTPPRWRGGHRHDRGAARPDRNTPASAGRTSSAGLVVTVVPEPLRRRGWSVSVRVELAFVRNTPCVGGGGGVVGVVRKWQLAGVVLVCC